MKSVDWYLCVKLVEENIYLSIFSFRCLCLEVHLDWTILQIKNTFKYNLNRNSQPYSETGCNVKKFFAERARKLREGRICLFGLVMP